MSKINIIQIIGKHSPLIAADIEHKDNLVFKTIKEASAYYKVVRSAISNQLKGKSKKLRNGKTFKYN